MTEDMFGGLCPHCGQPLPVNGNDQDDTDAFDQFWQAYPLKRGKVAAKKAFKKANGPAILAVLLSDIELRLKVDDQWRSKDYIMHPATYLNGQRWTDDIVTRRLDTSNWEPWGHVHCKPGAMESYDNWKPRVLEAMKRDHEERMAEAVRAAGRST